MFSSVDVSFRHFLIDAINSDGRAYISVEKICRYPLYSEESEYVVGSVDRRVDEFSTGRWMARKGLAFLGCPPHPITKGEYCQPIWPKGFIGSLTHENNLCALVIGRSELTSFSSIGIDLAYCYNSIDPGMELSSLFVSDESEVLAVTQLYHVQCPYLALLSLKESAVKALSGHFNSFLDLKHIRFDLSGRKEVLYGPHRFPVDLFLDQYESYVMSAVTII